MPGGVRNVDHVSHPCSNTITDDIGFTDAQSYEYPVGKTNRYCIGKSQLVANKLTYGFSHGCTYKPAYQCAERPAESEAVDNTIAITFTVTYHSANKSAQ